MKRWALRAAVILGALGALGALVVVSGIIPLTASGGHWKITEWFLHFTMRRSVATHSMTIEVPPLDDERLVMMGAGHYEHGCRFCHGAPGIDPPRIVDHMTPHPPNLWTHVGEDYDDEDLFYVIRHGIKMTGMPAWPGEGREDEVWAVVAFVRKMRKLDHEDYRRLVHGDEHDRGVAPEIVAERCARCHGGDGLGRGEGAFPRIAGQSAEYLTDALRAYADDRRQSGIMEPIAAGLSGDDLREVVRWYAAQPAPGGRGGGSARGEEIARVGIPEARIPACAYCHGPGHEPRHPAYPRLAGQWPEYIEQQLELFAKGTRGGGEYAQIMDVVTSHELEPEHIRAVAAYYASLAVTP